MISLQTVNYYQACKTDNMHTKLAVCPYQSNGNCMVANPPPMDAQVSVLWYTYLPVSIPQRQLLICYAG